MVYNLHDPERSYFNLILEQVDASALLAAYPDAAAQVQGPVDLRLRGNLGRRWHGSGGADLTRGRVFGAAVDELHLPVTFEFSPARQSGRVAIRDANAQLAGGRATGQAEFDWSGGEAPRLEGNARFNNAEVRSLVKPGGSLGSYLVGRITGRVDFGSDGLRSLDDLEATVSATLADSQALEIPVLNVLAPYLAPGQSATTFQKGDLRGRLSRGVFRLQRLTLSSSIARMAIVGTVNTQGRLNLDVTGSTGTLGVNPTFLQAIGLRIPAVGPIPVSLILEASRPAVQSCHSSARDGHGAQPERADRDGAGPGRGGGALLRAAERGAGSLNEDDGLQGPHRVSLRRRYRGVRSLPDDNSHRNTASAFFLTS